MTATRLTKQQQVLCGVMGVAAIAFLADHFLIRPGEASAASAADEYAIPRDTPSTAAPRTSASPAPAAIAPAPRPPASPEARLAARLRELTSDSRTTPPRDPFVVTPKLGVAAARPSPEPAAEASSGTDRRHRLDAVLAGADRSGTAIVDGKAIRVGGRLDGMELLRVTPGVAVFGDGNRSLILRMSEVR